MVGPSSIRTELSKSPVDSRGDADQSGAMFQPLYTAVATAHGGREGRVQTDDGQLVAD
jgi:hypothetical protein